MYRRRLDRAGIELESILHIQEIYREKSNDIIHLLINKALIEARSEKDQIFSNTISVLQIKKNLLDTLPWQYTYKQRPSKKIPDGADRA